MNKIQDFFRSLTSTVNPLPAGTYHYQAPPDSEFPYRLHLRLEPGGEGILVVNASTVLHLNQTAAEYAYHLVSGTPDLQVGKLISARYRVSPEQAFKDFYSLRERIHTLIQTPDLDPVTFLDFERTDPHANLSAPLRLDIALTYRVPDGSDPRATPQDRVRRELTHEEWSRILEITWQAGIPHLIFTGGEPTLRGDLPELVRQAEEQGQVTGLITDGLRLSEPATLHRLLQAGLDHLMIVFRPLQDESWEALRDVLVEDIATTVHLTLTPDNLAEIPALLERLSGMGVRSVSLSASSPELAGALLETRASLPQHAMTLVWDLPVPYSALHPVALEVGSEAPSGAGRVSFYVEPDGDVLAAQGSGQVLGSLLEGSWSEIWQKANQAG